LKTYTVATQLNAGGAVCAAEDAETKSQACDTGAPQEWRRAP
jgi:hypothetical protein